MIFLDSDIIIRRSRGVCLFAFFLIFCCIPQLVQSPNSLTHSSFKCVSHPWIEWFHRPQKRQRQCSNLTQGAVRDHDIIIKRSRGVCLFAFFIFCCIPQLVQSPNSLTHSSFKCVSHPWIEWFYRPQKRQRQCSNLTQGAVRDHEMKTFELAY